jgi:hypothetical protein
MKPHYTNTNNPIDFPKLENKMNERIENFAKQCYVKTGSPHTDHFAYWKFAELIIQECLSIIEQRKAWIEFPDQVNETHQWMYGYEKAVDHCAIFIKEYLGSKE